MRSIADRFVTKESFRERENAVEAEAGGLAGEVALLALWLAEISTPGMSRPASRVILALPSTACYD
jgi:hypothetical protein